MVVSKKEKEELRKNLESAISYQFLFGSIPLMMFIMVLLFTPIYNIFGGKLEVTLDDIKFGLKILGILYFWV